MIQDLGGSITTQIKGTINGIRRFGDTIIFSEIILAENTDRVQEMRQYSIPVDSVVVAVAPLALHGLTRGSRPYSFPRPHGK